MKNGSFDIAFRTMTLGLLMFLVLSIVSLGIHNLRPGGGSGGPLAENGQPAVQTPAPRESDRATDDIRREFASSLARVSDRLAGIEQRFATLTPPAASTATAEEARLQSAIEATQRRLQHLGDRLTDRIHAVSAGSEVELRDLNRQLAQLLDEQQQIQEQMVSVRVAAESRARPARIALAPNSQTTAPAGGPPRQTRQDRLTQNIEAMVGELASLREQLQAVRIAAANIDETGGRSTTVLKVGPNASISGQGAETEATVDKTVPEPSDLDVVPPSDTPKKNAAAASGKKAAVAPSNTVPETSSLPTEPARIAVADKADADAEGNWQVPIAARPVSTIFPLNRRSDASTRTQGSSTLSSGPQTPRQATAPRKDDSGSAIRIPLPAPAPLTPGLADPSLPTPRSLPTEVADLAEPALLQGVPAAMSQPAAIDLSTLAPQEVRKIGREIPTNALRAPLQLAEAPARSDGPVVRPFEVPTRKAERVQERNAEDSSKAESPLSSLAKFALTSSDASNDSSGTSRSVTNAKWRAARDSGDENGPRPALRDSRSLFPIFSGKSSSSGSSRSAEESSAADSQIPRPLQLPRNLIESSAVDRVRAPGLIDQVGAELSGAGRRYAVQASVLHVTADDLTSVDRAGVKSLAVMGGHDFRVNQIRQAVRESEQAAEIYSGTLTVTGGIPTRIPIGWLCPHCNAESGVASGDQLVVTLPHTPGNNSAAFYVEQADGTGRSESFRDATALLIPGASVQITEAAQDGQVETATGSSTPVLASLPVIGEKFEKTSSKRQIMQRIIVLTIRELSGAQPQTIQQLSAHQTSGSRSQVIHADATAPVRTSRQAAPVRDSSGATATMRGSVLYRQPAPPVED